MIDKICRRRFGVDCKPLLLVLRVSCCEQKLLGWRQRLETHVEVEHVSILIRNRYGETTGEDLHASLQQYVPTHRKRHNLHKIAFLRLTTEIKCKAQPYLVLYPCSGRKFQFCGLFSCTCLTVRLGREQEKVASELAALPMIAGVFPTTLKIWPALMHRNQQHAERKEKSPERLTASWNLLLVKLHLHRYKLDSCSLLYHFS